MHHQQQQQAQINSVQHTTQQQPQTQQRTNQESLDSLFKNDDANLYFDGDQRPNKAARLFKLQATYDNICQVYNESDAFRALDDICHFHHVELVMVDSGAAASVFTIDRPCVCTGPCEATLTGFNGVEQQVQERALYSLPVFASTRDGPSVKMEIMAQGFQLPGLKHSILSETVLCKENNYVRGDILFDCPCLVRTADWHGIRLFEVDNTFLDDCWRFRSKHFPSRGHTRKITRNVEQNRHK